MVTTIKDDDGKIVTYCEWRLVGQSGYETPSGKYIWVNDLWVHESVRHTQRVGRIIDEIMRLVPQAEYCYFQRKDKNIKLRLFSRRQWERRRVSHDPLIKGEK